MIIDGERNELKLAKLCQLITNRYNFANAMPYSQGDVDKARKLYKKIFYNEDFDKKIYKNKNLVFDADSIGGIYTCNRCCRAIFGHLKVFAHNVISKSKDKL